VLGGAGPPLDGLAGLLLSDQVFEGVLVVVLEILWVEVPSPMCPARSSMSWGIFSSRIFEIVRLLPGLVRVAEGNVHGGC
jgi:hypothetical protein